MYSGGAGVYGDGPVALVFSLSNYYNTGSAFQVEPVSFAASGIGFKFLTFPNYSGRELNHYWIFFDTRQGCR